jgi:competence protein ComEA
LPIIVGSSVILDNPWRLSMTKLNRYWLLSIILLAAIITVGSIMVWSRYTGSQPIEISISSGQELPDRVYIGGAVSNPGFYPLRAGDNLPALIQAAGGTTSAADLSGLKIYIPQVGEETEPQKINLNRAEAWLLEALPGIGEVRAQAIIDYRHQNGPFRNISELTKVAGIGISTYEQIKHLITVAN